ncbi:MAG: glycoside hydrolase family 13 protein, partial [Christensenellaceae bacterium]|nr:glycoside hydrolase family 13 protein [Christensenellaceae bacterium]
MHKVLYNSRNSRYKFPFGAIESGAEFRITFPVSESLYPKKAYLFMRKWGSEFSESYEIPYHKQENGFSVYEGNFAKSEVGIWFYRFEVLTFNGDILFVGNDGTGQAFIGDSLPEWQLTVYAHSDNPPSFLDGGLIYHIFADRFCRVEDGKAARFGRMKAWNDDVDIIDPEDCRNEKEPYTASDFFGGNIKGIASKIPYFKKLGVTALYLSPITESVSNHRYDTADYLKIDPLFGTEDEFKALCEALKNEGISVILDGVFNHTGSDSVYFNKFGHFGTNGAAQSKDSPYYKWYTFYDYPSDYHSWWGCTNVPTVRRDAHSFQDFICNQVIPKYLKLGAAAFRLDVVDELSIEFTKSVATAIKRVDKNALVIGEVWEDATVKESYGEKRAYLLGGELDGVMNYPFRTAIIDFVTGIITADEFCNIILRIVENYPKNALANSMTLLG